MSASKAAGENQENEDKSNLEELDDKSKRIHELMSDLISLRKRLKKEEESKK